MATAETVNTATANWSETRMLGAYSPRENVGVYVHAGRLRKDLGMWWVHLAAFLPDGTMVVDRSYGRDVDREVVRTGSFEMRQCEDGVCTTHDGAGERTTTSAASVRPRGAGPAITPFQWDVRLTGLSATWDMYGGAPDDGVRNQFAGDSHMQQTMTAVGSLTVDGQSYPIDGVGWRDHSSGVREFRDYSRHHGLYVVMPGWSAHTFTVFGSQGDEHPTLGAIHHRDGGRVPVRSVKMEPLDGIECGPAAGTARIEACDGTVVDARYELVHRLPICINGQGDNMNGIDWDDPSRSFVISEAIARLTLSDGTVGYAFHERGTTREALGA